MYFSSFRPTVSRMHVHISISNWRKQTTYKKAVGFSVGKSVGSSVGLNVGSSVGWKVGNTVGTKLNVGCGVIVGENCACAKKTTRTNDYRKVSWGTKKGAHIHGTVGCTVDD